MGLENVNYINDLNPTWPLGTDPKSDGDDHIRRIKLALKNTFPNLNNAVTATPAELNITIANALKALAALTPAADRLPYYTGSNAAELTILTAYIRTLLAASDAAAARAILGAGIANGLATLDANVRVPEAQLGSGTANSTTFLRGDRTWATLVASGRLLRITRYTSPGSGTWTKPSDTVSILIRAVGGGGGGGGGDISINTNQTSGGGAGGYTEIFISSAASSYAYTIGAGGAGGSGGSGGSNGGNTTIAGMTAGGGGGGWAVGGPPGSASGGHINIPGGAGTAGIGGAGGVVGCGGTGGSSYFGGAGRGVHNIGATAGAFGGGGGGAYNGSGAPGGAGYIEIWEFA